MWVIKILINILLDILINSIFLFLITVITLRYFSKIRTVTGLLTDDFLTYEEEFRSIVVNLICANILCEIKNKFLYFTLVSWCFKWWTILNYGRDFYRILRFKFYHFKLVITVWFYLWTEKNNEQWIILGCPSTSFVITYRQIFKIKKKNIKIYIQII